MHVCDVALVHSLPQLKATFCLPIIGVKKNPQSPTYTQLGVITKGTVIEVYIYYVYIYTGGCQSSPLLFLLPPQVNISELGLVTQSGKVIWGE